MCGVCERVCVCSVCERVCVCVVCVNVCVCGVCMNMCVLIHKLKSTPCLYKAGLVCTFESYYYNLHLQCKLLLI